MSDVPARRALTELPFLAALGLLVLNDHGLKGAGLLPGALTGKLSDVAGLFVAGLLAAALAGARGQKTLFCHALVGVAFAWVKVSPGSADLLSRALSLLLPSRVLADPTDLVALPALGLSLAHLARLERRPTTEGRPSRGAVGLAMGLGLLGCLASGAKPVPLVPPLPTERAVHVPFRGEAVLSLDPASGKPMGRAELSYDEAPLLLGGAAFAAFGPEVTALRLEDGKLLWKRTMPNAWPADVVAAGGDAVYARFRSEARRDDESAPPAYFEERLVAYRALDGQRRWVRSFLVDRTTGFAAGAGLLAVLHGGFLVGVDPETGEDLFRLRRPRGEAPPVLDEARQQLLVLGDGPNPFVLRAGTSGKRARLFPLPRPALAVRPSLDEARGVLYYASPGALVALDARALRELWASPAELTTPAALAGERIAVIDAGALEVLGAKGGALAWRAEADPPLVHVAALGEVFFARSSRHLYAFSGGGRLLWSRDFWTGGPAPPEGTPRIELF